MKALRACSWLLAACSLVFGACTGGNAHEIVVSAASSLTGVFSEMKAAFEAEHPDTNVILNFGGSSALREQILEGAPVDVFASANTVTMDQVAALVDVPSVFAINRLAIAVPTDNPGGVSSLADFGRPELLIGLCSQAVPCGSLARVALADANVEPAVDSDEPDVRALLTKIEAGELDAGIVYATDVLGADVGGIPLDVATEYPIAALIDAPNPRGAADFLTFVLSDVGQAILQSHGFGTP